jgi:hypothetical protein
MNLWVVTCKLKGNKTIIRDDHERMGEFWHNKSLYLSFSTIGHGGQCHLHFIHQQLWDWWIVEVETYSNPITTVINTVEQCLQQLNALAFARVASSSSAPSTTKTPTFS